MNSEKLTTLSQQSHFSNLMITNFASGKDIFGKKFEGWSGEVVLMMRNLIEKLKISFKLMNKLLAYKKT